MISSSQDPVLLDTGYLFALLSPNDDFHAAAKELHATRIGPGRRTYVAGAVLVETGNLLRSRTKMAADTIAEFLNSFDRTPGVTVVWTSGDLFSAALKRLRIHADKEWSLTDCISMEVMERNGIREVATADHHFHQAQYVALLLV